MYPVFLYLGEFKFPLLIYENIIGQVSDGVSSDRAGKADDQSPFRVAPKTQYDQLFIAHVY